VSRRAAGWLLVAVAVLAVAVVGWRLSRRAETPAPGAPAAVAGPLAAVPADLPRRTVALYFPGPNGRLYPEQRELAMPEDPAAQLAVVAQAVLAGPASPGLEPPFPSGVGLGAALLGEDGTAYLDLRAGEGIVPPAGGSRRELQVVYALVDSVLRAVPPARRVVLLWNGTQPVSFAGHLDLTRPLVGSDGLIAEPRGAAEGG
jgi:hypothetical protein